MWLTENIKKNVRKITSNVCITWGN